MKLLKQMCSGLRSRLLLLVLLVCAPLVGLILHEAWDERRAQSAEWGRHCREMTELSVREETKIVAQTQQLLLALARSSQVKAGHRRECKRLLDDLFASYPCYANLGVIQSNGEYLATAVPTPALTATNLPFFERVIESAGCVIGDFPAEASAGKPILNFACPVQDEAGRVQAVAFASLDLNWYQRFSSGLSAQLPQEATWTEIDEKGRILVRYPAPEDWMGRTYPKKEDLRTFFGQSAGILHASDSQGVSQVYAFESRRSLLTRGRVVAILGIPRQTLLAGVNRTLRRELAGLGIAAGVALGLGMASSRFLILRPVRTLLKSTRQLGEGDLKARTGLPHGTDELGQLSRAFDEMAQALERRELQRRRAEETLQTRENMIRELPLLPAAVCVCDNSGVIELYNRSAVDLWGYEPDDRYASKRYCGAHKLFSPDGAPMSHDDSPMAEALRSGGAVRNREMIIERPDGARVTVLANVVPIRDLGGRMVGAVNCLQDISDRKQAEEKLLEYSNSLQTLSHKLVEAQETERRHIARELHDEVGQTLLVATMNLQAALRSPGTAALATYLNASAEAVERVLRQVHDMSLNLRPSMLDDFGLESALRWYAQQQASLTGLRADLYLEPLERRLDPVIETECFRVAQEALTNVVRHARASAVAVELHKADGHLHLCIRDDGVGFDVAAEKERAVHGASLGMLSMEERATLAGGSLECRSNLGQGTEVHAWFPLKWLPQDS